MEEACFDLSNCALQSYSGRRYIEGSKEARNTSDVLYPPRNKIMTVRRIVLHPFRTAGFWLVPRNPRKWYPSGEWRKLFWLRDLSWSYSSAGIDLSRTWATPSPHVVTPHRQMMRYAATALGGSNWLGVGCYNAAAISLDGNIYRPQNPTSVFP